MHKSTRSKELVAKILETFGPRVGLGLEIGSDRAAELERIKQGEATPKPEDWFSDENSEMGVVFKAAREMNTPIFPLDRPKNEWEPQALEKEDPDHAIRVRDPHMAEQAGAALHKVDKLLILMGDQHLYQQPEKFLGPRLAETYGSDLFRAVILDESRIDMGGHLGAISQILSVAFDGRDSPAFDLDGSPLSRAMTRIGVPLPEAMDGVIFATGIMRSSTDPQDYCEP